MPSEEHEKLKARAMCWLSSRSTGKGVRAATEARVGDQYVADVVAWASLQIRHNKKFLSHTFGGQLPHPPSRPISPYGWIFECKATREDFLSTFGSESHHGKRRRKCRANWHLCVTEPDVEVQDVLPRWWGHLVRSGSGLSVERLPQYCWMLPEDEHHLTREVMWKQKNPTMKKVVKLLMDHKEK